jgi:hypothetical protein
MADALAKATRSYFNYASNWQVEGRDLVFVECNFGVDMSAETGDSYTTAVGGLELVRLAIMEFGASIIAEGDLYATSQKKSFVLSGPAGLATALFEDNTVAGSLEKAIRDMYTAGAALSKTTANWGSTAVTVFTKFGPNA